MAAPTIGLLPKIFYSGFAGSQMGQSDLLNDIMDHDITYPLNKEWLNVMSSLTQFFLRKSFYILFGLSSFIIIIFAFFKFLDTTNPSNGRLADCRGYILSVWDIAVFPKNGIKGPKICNVEMGKSTYKYDGIKICKNILKILVKKFRKRTFFDPKFSKNLYLWSKIR